MATKDWKLKERNVDVIIWKKGSQEIDLVSHANRTWDVFVNNKIIIGNTNKATALKIAKTYMGSH